MLQPTVNYRRDGADKIGRLYVISLLPQRVAVDQEFLSFIAETQAASARVSNDPSTQLYNGCENGYWGQNCNI
ncbi:hypothetical protein MAR_031373 [Mya arenaria]|uniref:Uncharacterized protein n=1 Tax=Mya arenaria TaxID=6604 RepID=A0ABY7F6K2_MYAAR|nr:hypothetical protein MAR_031373 [Mya arenaria]